MKKLHIAIGTHQFEKSIQEYNIKLNQKPDLIIHETYALWRTADLNLSLRILEEDKNPGIRHIGWEDNKATRFCEEADCNGIVWEHFSAQQQADEINDLWKDTNYLPND
ncbi:MAG: hypothetical protein COA79_12240 [Planctomycetota bacterium]|nr:MAG: hypothetical protein COA79_12240 [Planctomycetota bacterium]